MPTEKPNTIKISELRHYEVPADRADLHVTVEGASLFTGQEALHKAREVAALVHGLTEYGLPAENIFLQGIYADKYTGTLARTSHARYDLRVHCAALNTLIDLLGIVTAQKNATLNFIEWGYPLDDMQKDQWLQQCITRANEKAEKIAAGLGVRLLGIHAFSERYTDQEATRRKAVEDDGIAFRRRTLNLSGDNLGLEVSHTQKAEVYIEVEYLIPGYDSAE